MTCWEAVVGKSYTVGTIMNMPRKATRSRDSSSLLLGCHYNKNPRPLDNNPTVLIWDVS